MSTAVELNDVKPREAAQVTHSEHIPSTAADADQNVREWIGVAEGARQATQEEHEMTIWEAIRKYPRACLWSMAISLTVIMDGYDTALLGSLLAFPSFQSRFGVYVTESDNYQIQAHWQLALGASSTIGSIIGIYIGAITTDRLGYKRSLIMWLMLLCGFIFICFFAKNIGTIFAGEVLAGTSWGVFTTMAPAYASEVSPVVLRGFLEIFVQACWRIGQLLSFSVLLTLNSSTSQWAWRIPFAVQWVFPAIIIPLIMFAPESPWWHVRKGEHEKAELCVMALSGKIDRQGAKQAVALMIQTNDFEKALDEGTGYAECFKGINRWRTEIVCVCWSMQVWAGFSISSYSTYFFELAGLASDDAYKMSVGKAGLLLLCNFGALALTAKVGRRRIFLCGLAAMGTLLFVIGCIALAPSSMAKAVGFASSTLYILWNVCYEFSVGMGTYIIAGEVSSTRLRKKTVGLGRNAYNAANLVNYFAAPYILNPAEGNWKGKTGFLAAGLCLACWTWAWLRLPETKGRTYEELDTLFSRGLKARQFKKQPINLDVANAKEEVLTSE